MLCEAMWRRPVHRKLVRVECLYWIQFKAWALIPASVAGLEDHHLPWYCACCLLFPCISEWGADIRIWYASRKVWFKVSLTHHDWWRQQFDALWVTAARVREYADLPVRVQIKPGLMQQASSYVFMLSWCSCLNIKINVLYQRCQL